MGTETTSTATAPTQAELKKIEETLDAFSAELERTLPPGLNSRLSRPERALLRTFMLWARTRSLDSLVLDQPVEEDEGV